MSGYIFNLIDISKHNATIGSLLRSRHEKVDTLERIETWKETEPKSLFSLGPWPFLASVMCVGIFKTRVDQLNAIGKSPSSLSAVVGSDFLTMEERPSLSGQSHQTSSQSIRSIKYMTEWEGRNKGK